MPGIDIRTADRSFEVTAQSVDYEGAERIDVQEHAQAALGAM